VWASTADGYKDTISMSIGVEGSYKKVAL